MDVNVSDAVRVETTTIGMAVNARLAAKSFIAGLSKIGPVMVIITPSKKNVLNVRKKQML
jgi:hypothetical protein